MVLRKHFTELEKVFWAMDEDIAAFSEHNSNNNFSESFEIHSAQLTIEVIKLLRHARRLQNTVWYGTPPKEKHGGLILEKGK